MKQYIGFYVLLVILLMGSFTIAYYRGNDDGFGSEYFATESGTTAPSTTVATVLQGEVCDATNNYCVNTASGQTTLSSLNPDTAIKMVSPLNISHAFGTSGNPALQVTDARAQNATPYFKVANDKSTWVQSLNFMHPATGESVGSISPYDNGDLGVNATRLNVTGALNLNNKPVATTDMILPGSIGPQGDKGDRGDKGEKGDKGDKGDQGLRGLQGIQGEKGDQGLPGINGANGKDGLNGMRGEKGEPGAPGKDGVNGKDGAPGDRGPPGPAVVMDASTLQRLTGPAGKDGTNGKDGKDGGFDANATYPKAKVNKLHLGNKFVLSGEGDWAANDTWLRLMNSAMNAYGGGIAANELWATNNIYGTSLVGNGGNGGRLHITGGELLYLLNKDGVIVGKEWGGNGNLSVQGKLSVNGTDFAHVPRGVIVLWSGAINNIPDGWSLCNGQNGTPDLRNRFVVGAGNTYAVGGTGGSASSTLSVANLPNHTHSGSTLGAGEHTHTPYGPNNNVNDTPSQGYPRDNNHQSFRTSDRPRQRAVNTAALSTAPNHTHTFTTDATPGANATPFSTLPPYYALAYIMKL